MLARQVTLPYPFSITLTPLPRYSCELFVALANVKSFGIKQIRALCAKYPGWGYRASCRIPIFLLSPLSTAFMPKRRVTPLSTAFTRLDRGGGVLSAFFSVLTR